MSVSPISTDSWDSLDNIDDTDDEDELQNAVQKVSSRSAPLTFRKLVREIRRHSDGGEIILKHFAHCESVVYIGSEKAEKVLIVVDDTTVIDVEPWSKYKVLLKSAILNAPKIVFQNVYNLEVDSLEHFHGKKQVKADNLKMAEWFLDFLEKREKSVRIDAYYAGLTQIDDVMAHLRPEKYIRFRRFSEPIWKQINSNNTVTGVGYDVWASVFLIPRKHSITLDVSEVMDNNHLIILKNPLPPETRELVLVMGGHPRTFIGLPPFQRYFKVDLDRFVMCFDYVINPKNTTNLTNVAINIVSRLLHWIRLARPDASIEKAITVLMFFMWEHDDPKIDQDQFKDAVANSPEVIEAIAQLHQSTGPTCVIAVDFGCVRGTKTPTELISVELPRNL